jgi:hypothetical protein
MLLGSVILISVFSSAAFPQQRHVIDPATLASVTSQHAGKLDADRAAIREALASPEVREVAVKAGIDLDRLAAATETLSGDDLERAADAARQVNDRLVGGQRNFVISTTTIIIALLVVILIIVAVD